MTNQIPSLSYGMPNCPSCERQGLVLTDKEHVACIYCDYKRDFSVSVSPKKPQKKVPDAGEFIFFLIVGLVLFLLLNS
ncbi:hypothetical protein [Leptothoe sp. PORK10 BA2]|uniref:hypothetical protein n=1 Tax=Leptothoe sp. PORK10 BA2 TaxID=3110254 RepID=UPI002B1F85C7|nr:hypothetical protein [Leptothoe sp. PORK10 BA2]MEA5464453.1 hypothetical protein [Leptothoe sp. PORK10 BA2]